VSHSLPGRSKAARKTPSNWEKRKKKRRKKKKKKKKKGRQKRRNETAGPFPPSIEKTTNKTRPEG
jgi:hypothetical protein